MLAREKGEKHRTYPYGYSIAYTIYGSRSVRRVFFRLYAGGDHGQRSGRPIFHAPDGEYGLRWWHRLHRLGLPILRPGAKAVEYPCCQAGLVGGGRGDSRGLRGGGGAAARARLAVGRLLPYAAFLRLYGRRRASCPEYGLCRPGHHGPGSGHFRGSRGFIAISGAKSGTGYDRPLYGQHRPEHRPAGVFPQPAHGAAWDPQRLPA